MTVLVLGDQLTRRAGPLAARPDERVLMIESRAFARRRPYHPHKLTLLFSAMRHFRDHLRAEGRTVDYRQTETFGEALDDHFQQHPGDDLVVMNPSSHGAAERLRELVTDRGGSLTVVQNDCFLCSADRFDELTDGPPYRHEEFYRGMRRETGYLMDGDEPVGGRWNFDEQNREFPGTDYEPPDPPQFESDDLTTDTREWVHETFDVDWADPDPFCWPVTREQALTALDDFLEHRLPEFGPFQDAMVGDEWAMNHALLAPALNLGLLHPREVVEAAVDALDREEVPLNSVEGFVRQVLGWREFVRHVYRRTMPDLAAANQLGADRDLPEFYWSGDTDAACIEDVVAGVRERGYSHHIERLMVLSNFALLFGVEPRQLNEWFHAAYVDAYHWVTTPNVVEMGLYAAGVFATKPYAASANYVDGMSDHCEGCPYDPDATTGAGACPFNSLYWDFLARNEDELRSNHRMGLVYSHLDDKREAGDLQAIRERAATVRDQAADGDL